MSNCPHAKIVTTVGSGGETHQRWEPPSKKTNLTTNQGVVIADNQNSLKVGPDGPTLLEDFILREKITHFDHERIPERIVHARGSGAFGYFYPTKSLSDITSAGFLQVPKKKTRVFARFSTVAGGAGSSDMVRDVRGFAVKFYTEEGNFDLVGNNIPVFFIQDAIKFPDLIHSVKMEPNSGVPQASSAHSTFWDFASLMPESMNMLMYAMSDYAIPRSFRTMNGFGIHTFRLVNSEGKSTFVRFYWKPVIGATSNIWSENVNLNGVDDDYFRRDLWNAIQDGNYPAYDFFIQTFDQDFVDAFEFNVFDSTKIIPEEQVPLTHVGRMVLDENPENFFAQTEQIAFCPANIVPGIDFSDDPLLQGRLFSYLDTQLIRLGGPNFNELPVNRPICPVRNFQRDGYSRQKINKGRVAYEPNSLAPLGPRENPTDGFKTYPSYVQGRKVRARGPSFADHYSQARQFWKSMTSIERQHIVSAFSFELSNIDSEHVRLRVLGMLRNVSLELYRRVSRTMGLEGKYTPVDPVVPAQPLPTLDSLSLIENFKPTIRGRTTGILITDGIKEKKLDRIKETIRQYGGSYVLISQTISGVTSYEGNHIQTEALPNSPSVKYESVILLPSKSGIHTLNTNDVVGWIRSAFDHLRAIGYSCAAVKYLQLARIPLDAKGVVQLCSKKESSIRSFIKYAKQNHVWNRDTELRSDHC